MIGHKWGKMEVIGKTDESHPKKGKIWECQCSCGNKMNIGTSDIRRERWKECEECKLSHSKSLPIRTLYSNYRREAEKRGYVFELTYDEFRLMIQDDCFYCSSEPLSVYWKEGWKAEPLSYNGIDRIDNEEGYTKENTVTCCKFCNMAKGRGTIQEFINWITNIRYDAK